METSKCKSCQTTLTEMPTGCSRCLKCNPISKAPVVEERTETKYVDVPWTEERIKKLIRDELENWHIQKPPVTKDEIPPIDWRQQARDLDIPLVQETGGARKKIDVMADIEAKNAG